MVTVTLFQKVKQILLRPFANQSGQSIIIIAFAFLGLIAMLGLALDLGLVYIEQTRIKRAVDAAVLAGVVELPSEERTIIRAVNYLDQNGYRLRDSAGNAQINVYIRGCAHDGYLSNTNFKNYHDLATPPNITYPGRMWTPQWSVGSVPVGSFSSGTTVITGTDKYYLFYPANGTRVTNPQAEFFIDTRTYQAKSSEGPPPVFLADTEQCNIASSLLGTANKINLRGVVPVSMNFMQFFGFSQIAVADDAIAQNVTNLDVSIVFDMSGSMQFGTTCYGCYEPFGDGAVAWKNLNGPSGIYPLGQENTYPIAKFVWPIPVTHLPAKNIDGSNASLSYGFAAGNTALAAPNPQNTGKLCFGRDGNSAAYFNKGGGDPVRWIVAEGELYSLNTSLLVGPARQPGRGFWAVQNTNLRTVHKMIPETWDPDSSYDTGATPILSSYSRKTWVSHHPYTSWALDPQTGVTAGEPFGHDYTLTEVRDPLKTNDVPSLEYDFVTASDWDRSSTGGNNDNTRIWLRAQHGGSFADANGDGNTDSTSTLFWAAYLYSDLWGAAGGDPTAATPLGTGQIEEIGAKPNSVGAAYGGADGGRWLWVELTNDTTKLDLQNGQRYVLKIWAGSVGFDIDRVVIGNQKDTRFQTESSLPATEGSAFREACNRCNPIYGLNIANAADCSAKDNGAATVPGNNTDWGDPRQNMLFSGYQPIRDAKEAVKNFIRELKPQFDQVGIVSYSGSSTVPDDGRVELRCRRFLSADQCFQGTNPISYTEVLNKVEILPPNGGTNMAGGMLKGLEMLGISTGGAIDNLCNTAQPLTSHCSRGGSARRIMIVMTDGVANVSPNNTCKVQSLWPPTSGTHTGEDNAKDCVMYYADIAAKNNVTVYTIGLGNGTDTKLLEAVAKMPGSDGEYYAAANSAQLTDIFQTILKSVSVRLIQ